MKAFAEKFYCSKSWRRCRKSYLAKVFGLCERCGEIAKIVHHRIMLTPANINDVVVTLSHDNLEALCQECHNHEHHGTAERVDLGYFFDERGNIVYTPHGNF